MVKVLALGLLLAWHSALAQTNPFPQVASAYLVQVDHVTLWEKQAARRLPPASLTKLMTALLAIESGPLDSAVSVSQAAAAESGSRLHLRPGSRFTMDAMLKASMLQSANDACRALAEHVAGSEHEFVERMNVRARQMGLRDTHFANACGHDADGHYSSASDLAILAQRALENAFIRATARLGAATISSLDGNDSYQLINKNALIGRYSGIAGLKTGYTARAGKCLIAYAVRDRKQVLLVLLNAPNRWWDAQDMLDLAFSHAAR